MSRAGAVTGLLTLAAVLPALLTACSSTTFSTAFEKGVLPAEPDSGKTTDQQAVRHAVEAALTDENDAFVIGRSLRRRTPAEVLMAVSAPSASRTRAEMLNRARSASLAAKLEHSFSSYAHQEFGPTWRGSGTRSAWLDRDVWASSTFHVDRWQGVQISGDIARVLVRGEDQGTTWGGQARQDTWAQYKLLLRRDGTAAHGWRVTQEQASTTGA